MMRFAMLGLLAMSACANSEKLTAPPCAGGETRAANEGIGRPVVWDNQQNTYLRFSGHQSFPKITALRPDGKERTVSTTPDPDAGVIMVHGVYSTLLLRDGARLACIHNKAFDPYGTRPVTGATP